jgi:hypothetical protein
MRRPLLERVLWALVVLAFPVAAMLLLITGPVSAEDASPSPSESAAPATPMPTASFLVPQATPEPLPPLVPAPPMPTPLVHPSDGQSNTCFDCHLEINGIQRTISTDWQDSAHGKVGIGCADCHGGDPTSDQITVAMAPSNGFIGVPGRDAIVGICGSCHADVERMRSYNLPTDQYVKYFSSVHGQRLAAAGDTRVAICTDCHGVHDIKKISDPTALTYPTNVPALCASCHADADLMKPYGIPTDQYQIYQQSVHGKALLEDRDIRAPSCASCHGWHDAKPPQSTEVVEVCGKCHTATQALYEESRHAQLGSVAPKCWTCHGTHDVSPPGLQIFGVGEATRYNCEICHDPVTKELRLDVTLFANQADRRCDTCHHKESTIYDQAKAIHDSLKGAQDAYDTAAAKIAQAASLGMIVNDAQVALSEAKTYLIQAQASVHTTKLTVVAGHTNDTVDKSGVADSMAQAKIDEATNRRASMIIIVLLILANVGVFYGIKRRIDRDLPEEKPVK